MYQRREPWVFALCRCAFAFFKEARKGTVRWSNVKIRSHCVYQLLCTTFLNSKNFAKHFQYKLDLKILWMLLSYKKDLIWRLKSFVNFSVVNRSSWNNWLCTLNNFKKFGICDDLLINLAYRSNELWSLTIAQWVICGDQCMYHMHRKLYELWKNGKDTDT